MHNKPTFSQTVLFPHMYPNPLATPMFDQEGNPISYEAGFLSEHFEDFYEDVWLEFSKCGKLSELNVCDNIAEHLVGNVYAKFFREEDALDCLKKCKGRYYAGRLLYPEFSPVTDFREARCRQHETSECLRGGLCNFMHLRKLSKEFQREIFSSHKYVYDKPEQNKYELNEIEKKENEENELKKNENKNYETKEKYDTKSESMIKSMIPKVSQISMINMIISMKSMINMIQEIKNETNKYDKYDSKNETSKYGTKNETKKMKKINLKLVIMKQLMK